MENWQDEAEQRDLWLLDAEQLALLPGMTDKGRLGFAIQLKFIELYGRFPEDNIQINTNITQELAKQLSVPINAIASSDPCSRQGQRHRRIIRDFLGYRPSTGADLKQLFHWLCHEALPLDPLARHGRDVAFDWYRTQRIERSALSGRASRLRRSYALRDQSPTLYSAPCIFRARQSFSSPSMTAGTAISKNTGTHQPVDPSFH